MKKIICIIFLSVFVFPVNVFAQAPEEISLEEQLETLKNLETELEEISGQLDEFSQPIDTSNVGSEEVRARITEISFDEIVDDNRQMVFTAEADGMKYIVDTRVSLLEGLRHNLHVGDEVYLQVIQKDGSVTSVFLIDVVRTTNLFWLAVLFSLVIIVIGRWRGVASLAGLVITFVVLFALIVPSILAGKDPVFITIIGSLIILAVNMHLSHGFNKGTLYAFGSTVIGLALVWVFSNAFVAFAKLTGLASEEAILLQFHSETVSAPAGILLAAIILGAVGVLDDIAITQSETVAELREANPNLHQKELFTAAMRIGRHHIASTVNTLVLAYAGVALPLLLLFVHTQGVDVFRFLNEELVAEEIIRTLAGTLALVLTVPISTWLATYLNKR